MIELSLIVPIYQEEDSIAPFLTEVVPLLETKTQGFEIIFCLDPSSDNTENIILEKIENDPRIKLITLSKRFGQGEATLAGISKARGKFIVTIDVDLQDPPSLIPKMIEKAKLGFDVVYTKRLSRIGESWLKKKLAAFGYSVMSFLSSGQIKKECGDFRLISQRVAHHLINLKENQVFLRAQIPLVGFDSTVIHYHRQDRTKGEGHYNRYIGSIKMGLDGIFCFSTKPLLLIFITALFLFFPSLFWFIKQGIGLILGLPKASSASYIIASVTFLCAIQLLALSLISEYLARMFTEIQGRPRYIIDKFIVNKKSMVNHEKKPDLVD